MSDSKERGVITFFDVEKFGFYRLRKNKDGEPVDVDVDDLLLRLNSWLIGKKFQNTVPWGESGSSFNKIYCQSFYLDEDTGDFFLVLIKSVGAENGGVKGVKYDSAIGGNTNDTITSADGINANEVAWGQVMYYWFIPSKNKVASIRFRDSVCDINGLSQYIREWVKYRCDKYVGKVIETVREKADGTKSVVVKRMLYSGSEEKKGKKENKEINYSFQFKFLAKLSKQRTNFEDLSKVQDRITHFVFRSILSSTTEDKRLFAGIMDNMLKKIGFSVDNSQDGKIKKYKEYEVIVEDKPTYQELDKIFNEYTQANISSTGWENVGIKIDGRSNKTRWLDEYILKSEIYMNQKPIDKDTYSAVQIMNSVSHVREDLLSKINDDTDVPNNINDDADTSECDLDTSELVSDANGSESYKDDVSKVG
ncbi:hypothetical protein R7041_16015 [Vibrio sp. 1751]|uniref:hypothetical protein n=1 Tax=unclassified Vibrio TaxID=2614977 RepID=UPI0029643AC9|nr:MULTISPECIES: hypothetical protein [unclassified Vibrio]MDW2098843.1 hypothetical protein [Vibrio sp. 1751]MDW2243693.1 hypothetical protein [Vibrio sp. 1287]